MAASLRSLQFASLHQRQLLWVRAMDQPVGEDDQKLHGDQLQQARRRWLQLHDQQTGGVPGVFPLVLGLPVQFTCTYAREDHIFKFTRGRVVGWQLQPEDEAATCTADAEIVLHRLPNHILVEIADAAFQQQKGLPPGVYCVKPRTVRWARDKAGSAQVKRTGFVLTASFSGTAHSYTGATLPKAIVDCLDYANKPRKEDMTKSYVCLSRVRRADDLLVSQPFSPILFNLGAMPRPHLLLKRLRGSICDNDLQGEWEVAAAAYTRLERDVKHKTWRCGTCNLPKTIAKYNVEGGTRALHHLFEKVIKVGAWRCCTDTANKIEA